jgi:hypothetical protein
MPRRPTPSPRTAALLLVALAACADSATAPGPRPEAPNASLPAATAALDFSPATATYSAPFSFLFDAAGQPLAGGWPPHDPLAWAWSPSDFDVAKHSRDPLTWFDPQPFRGMHGTACQPYQKPEPDNSVEPGDAGSHAIASWADANYRCRNHMMTSLKASGYAAIYIAPNALVSLASGTATVRFALSTFRTSGNDWVDLWVTPWDDNLALPLDGSLLGVDLQGPPRQGIHIRINPGDRGRSAFEAYAIANFRETRLPSDARGYESFLTPTSTFRDTFELQLSRSRVKFGILARTAGAQTHPAFTWVDAAVSLPSSFNASVLQFGHHSMNQALADNAGVGGTWHWDDWRITPAIPFSIIRPAADASGGRVRSIDPRNAATPLSFERAAPSGSFLRFAAIGVGIQVSFDGGDTWKTAELQEAAVNRFDRFRSYWTPVPRGTTSVLFRALYDPDEGRPFQIPFLVQDPAIWSRSL